VKVVLHPEVSSTITVNVARSPEEAELQAQGVDVMAQMFERDSASFTEDVVPGSAANGDEIEGAAQAQGDEPVAQADQVDEKGAGEEA
jgi:large subunit ribosomal protein L9